MVVFTAWVRATDLYGAAALSFVIPSEAEGSAVVGIFRGNAEFHPQTKLPSRPDRTRISYQAELATSAVFFLTTLTL